MLQPSRLLRFYQRTPQYTAKHTFYTLARSSSAPRLPLVLVHQIRQFALAVRPTKTEHVLESAFLVTRIKTIRKLFEAVTDANASAVAAKNGDDDEGVNPDTLLQILASDDAVVSRLLADVDFRIAALGDSQSHVRQDLEAIAGSLRNLNYREKALALHKDSNDIRSHNAILLIHANSGDYEAALALVKRFIEKHGVQPNVVSFAHMIKAYGVAKKPADAKKWFDVYRNSDEPTEDAPYTNLIMAYVNSGDIPAAINIMLTILTEDSIPLTTIHMSAFMDALLLNKNHDLVIEWYNRLDSDETGRFPKPDARILDIVFDAAVHVNNEDLIQKLWPSSPERSPNTLSLCQYGLSKLDGVVDGASNQDDLGAVVRVFQILKHNKNLVSPAIPAFFESLININPAAMKESLPICDLEILQVAASLFVFPRIMQEMLRQAIANCGNDVKGAVRLFSVATTFMSPDENSKQLILDLYLNRGLWKLRGSTRVELETRDFYVLVPIAAPNPDTLKTVLDDMAARRLTVTKEISDAVVENLRAARKWLALNTWIRGMRKLDIIKGPRLRGEMANFVDLKMENATLIFNCVNHMLDKAMTVYTEILSSKMSPSISAISLLITRLFEANRVDEAVKVSQEMLERAKRTHDLAARDFAIHDALMSGWITVGNFPEALACSDYIIKTHHKLPYFRQISRITAKTIFHHQNKEGNPELVPLDLVGNSILKWLLFLPSPLVPTEVDLRSPVQALTLDHFIWILCKVGETREALGVYYALRNSGHPPRPASHKILLKSVAESSFLEKAVAVELLDDAMEQLSSVSNGNFGFLDGTWFDPVLEMHLTRFNDLESALSIWRVMKANEFRMGQVVSRKLAQKCLEKGDLAHAVEFLLLSNPLSTSTLKLMEQLIETVGDVESLPVAKVDQVAFAKIVARKCGSVFHLYSQKAMELALEILVREGEDVVSLANWLFKNYKSLSNGELSSNLILYMLRNGHLSQALVVLESMAPFSLGGVNARSLDLVSAVIYDALKLRDEAIAARVFQILESDGFTDNQKAKVKEAARQIKATIN
ncbi:hypothetical protein BDR26DRAFT_1006656 [Obelidium mucronatum]|nr:hypothetical protein BDR26DRAFT_1006656 [Obelidium mucronatum]